MPKKLALTDIMAATAVERNSIVLAWRSFAKEGVSIFQYRFIQDSYASEQYNGSNGLFIKGDYCGENTLLAARLRISSFLFQKGSDLMWEISLFRQMVQGVKKTT